VRPPPSAVRLELGGARIKDFDDDQETNLVIEGTAEGKIHVNATCSEEPKVNFPNQALNVISVGKRVFVRRVDRVHAEPPV